LSTRRRGFSICAVKSVVLLNLTMISGRLSESLPNPTTYLRWRRDTFG